MSVTEGRASPMGVLSGLSNNPTLLLVTWKQYEPAFSAQKLKLEDLAAMRGAMESSSSVSLDDMDAWNHSTNMSVTGLISVIHFSKSFLQEQYSSRINDAIKKRCARSRGRDEEVTHVFLHCEDCTFQAHHPLLFLCRSLPIFCLTTNHIFFLLSSL